MTTIDIAFQPWEHHREARAEIIREWEGLWRRAIERSGITDDALVDALLQVCAACYLDGMNTGSCLEMAMLIEEQLNRERIDTSGIVIRVE
jgi:hypothetical protein